MKIGLYLFFLFAVSSAIFATEESRAEEDDIRETVFRYEFEHNASAQQQDAAAYCLSFGDVKDIDPPGNFIKRFAHHKPPVRKASACKSGDFVVDKRTGKAALVFRVTKIEWISSTEVEVDGGYYEGNMSASGNGYRAKKELGKWKVTKDKGGWISQTLTTVRIRPCC